MSYFSFIFSLRVAQASLAHAARNPVKQGGNRRISKMDITDFQVLQHVWQSS